MKIKRTPDEQAKFEEKHKEEWATTGSKILEARQKLRISQIKLASMAGICPQTLRKLERGCYITRFKPISKSCINALALTGCLDMMTSNNLTSN